MAQRVGRGRLALTLALVVVDAVVGWCTELWNLCSTRAVDVVCGTNGWVIGFGFTVVGGGEFCRYIEVGRSVFGGRPGGIKIFKLDLRL